MIWSRFILRHPRKPSPVRRKFNEIHRSRSRVTWKYPPAAWRGERPQQMSRAHMPIRGRTSIRRLCALVGAHPWRYLTHIRRRHLKWDGILRNFKCWAQDRNREMFYLWKNWDRLQVLTFPDYDPWIWPPLSWRWRADTWCRGLRGHLYRLHILKKKNSQIVLSNGMSWPDSRILTEIFF